MKAATKILIVAFGVFAILRAIGMTAIYFSDDLVEVRSFEKSFASVDLGDSESTVLALLGDPNAKETDFHIGQEQGFEETYARTRASGSAYYLVWTKGVDVVFSVGINSKGTVRAKEYGGT